MTHASFTEEREAGLAGLAWPHSVTCRARCAETSVLRNTVRTIRKSHVTVRVFSSARSRRGLPRGVWHGAPLDDFLEPSTTLRVQFLRHLGPIDLNKGHCTTFLGAADFFCVLVHGLSGTRRAQTFFPVHCEPNATPGKTHGRHRGSPEPRTFSHFFNLILEGVYFYGG